MLLSLHSLFPLAARRKKRPRLLQRLRPTKVQWQLRRDERTENVHDAFAVKETIDVDKKHILLVDDIFTTGATLEACAHALKQKGAASVTGLVIASGAP